MEPVPFLKNAAVSKIRDVSHPLRSGACYQSITNADHMPILEVLDQQEDPLGAGRVCKRKFTKRVFSFNSTNSL